MRLPLATDSHLLYGLLSPYVSLGSSPTLGVPWATTLPPGLRRDPDGLEDVRLVLRGRLDAGVGRGLLQREPDTADFRAGFSIRLD